MMSLKPFRWFVYAIDWITDFLEFSEYRASLRRYRNKWNKERPMGWDRGKGRCDSVWVWGYPVMPSNRVIRVGVVSGNLASLVCRHWSYWSESSTPGCPATTHSNTFLKGHTSSPYGPQGWSSINPGITPWVISARSSDLAWPTKRSTRNLAKNPFCFVRWRHNRGIVSTPTYQAGRCHRVSCMHIDYGVPVTGYHDC